MVKDRRRNEENILDIRAGIIGSSDLRAIFTASSFSMFITNRFSAAVGGTSSSHPNLFAKMSSLYRSRTTRIKHDIQALCRSQTPMEIRAC
jgi:hypothetical protein